MYLDKHIKKIGAVLLAPLIGISTTAYAELEEVIVTAQKRQESVQDVPISATAYGATAIEKFHFQKTSDIGSQAPNINLVQGNFGFGAPIISVRGITNGDFSATSNTPVTVYSDDVVLSNIISHGFALYDLERIELLRGPQGTLFGRNATSGALQFYSAQPTNSLSAGLKLSYAKHNDISVTGYLSNELGNSGWLARVAMNLRSRDGVIKNTTLNKDESEIDNTSLRLMLQSPKGEVFNSKFKIQHSTADGTGVLFHNSLGDNPYTAAIESGGKREEFDQIQLNHASRDEAVELTETSAQLNWDFENFSITSVSGFAKTELEEFNDDDATAITLLHEYAYRESKQLSQELRVSTIIDNWDIVAGVFYLDAETKARGAFETTDNPVVGPAVFGFPAGTRSVIASTSNQDLTSKAIFAHGKYSISPAWSATVGARWTRDKKDLDQFNVGYGTFVSADEKAISIHPRSLTPQPALGTSGSSAGTTDSSAVTGELSVEYHPEDNWMTYASFRRGFKGSSFDTSNASPTTGSVPEVKKEIVDSFELGVKSTLMDQRIILNAAVFWYDYDNFQAFEYATIPGVGFVQVLFNLPEVEVKGVEVEIYAEPVDGLNMNFGIGVLDTEVTNANASLPAGFVLDLKKGNKIRNAADLNLNGSISYDFHSESFTITPQLDWFYVDEYYSDFINTKPGFIDAGGTTYRHGSIAGDYHQFDLRVTFTPTSEQYAITLFGENITDEVQVTGRFPLNGFNNGSDFATVNDGNRRVWGISFNYQM